MSRQYIEGAGFSLERLTDNVPQDGRYYLLQNAEIAGTFEREEDARRAYHDLCLSYWATLLASGDVRARVQAARGLLQRDRLNRTALETLAASGEPGERKYAAESLRRLTRTPMAA